MPEEPTILSRLFRQKLSNIAAVNSVEHFLQSVNCVGLWTSYCLKCVTFSVQCLFLLHILYFSHFWVSMSEYSFLNLKVKIKVKVYLLLWKTCFLCYVCDPRPSFVVMIVISSKVLSALFWTWPRNFTDCKNRIAILCFMNAVWLQYTFVTRQSSFICISKSRQPPLLYK